MGIKGLQYFMKHECKDIFERISLSEKAELYRCETGEDPVLLIDISSCAIDFFNASSAVTTANVLLGGLKAIKEDFEKFVSNCSQQGIKLKVFGEGKKPRYKYFIWVKNNMAAAENLMKIYSLGQIDFDTCPVSPKLGLFLHIVADVLKDKCEYSRAVWEADDDACSYLQSKQCFAVMSNDSDFLMLNNVRYCISTEEADFNSLMFFNYNRNSLAKILKINPSQLPLFASLCENYAFPCLDLKNLYRTAQIIRDNRFSKVAELMKDFASKEELLQHISSLMDPREVPYLEKRLNFYCGCEPDKVMTMSVNNTLWDKILNLALKRHRAGKAHCRILQIITDRVNFIPCNFENILEGVAGRALITLRKKIYGIIFFEYPNSEIYVTEFSLICLKDRGKIQHQVKEEKCRFPRRFHCGLETFWSSCCTKTDQILKKKYFCQAVNEDLPVDFLLSLNIPEEYLFPVLSAFYFLWELEKPVEDFEVKTILIQAVLVYNLSSEEMNELCAEFNSKAFDLAGWFWVIIQHLELLNSVCGAPFCERKTNTVNYFDGKIFQYVYGRMKEGEDPSTFIDPKMHKIFEDLNLKLLELGRICGYVGKKDRKYWRQSDDARQNRW